MLLEMGWGLIEVRGTLEGVELSKQRIRNNERGRAWTRKALGLSIILTLFGCALQESQAPATYDVTRATRLLTDLAKRLEDDCGTDLRAPGFPEEMVDEEPEEPGAEIRPRQGVA